VQRTRFPTTFSLVKVAAYPRAASPIIFINRDAWHCRKASAASGELKTKVLEISNAATGLDGIKTIGTDALSCLKWLMRDLASAADQ